MRSAERWLPSLSILFDTKGNFFYILTYAGVVKLVDARDSKSRGAQTPCRFDSDLRHQNFDNPLSSMLKIGC